jgi:hypothetical protein
MTDDIQNTRRGDKTAAMNLPITHPENCHTDRDETSPWDQPFFEYSDQPLQIEQPLPTSPARGGAHAVGEDRGHSDRQPIKKTSPVRKKKTPPIKKQSRNELVRSGASISGVDYLSHNRALRPDLVLAPPFAVPTWPIGERIGVLGLMVVAVAGVTMLLVSYGESLQDSVPPPSPSLAWRGDPLPSAEATAIRSAVLNDALATAARSAGIASPGEIPTDSQRPPRGLPIPENPALKADDSLRSPATDPMPSISPPRDALPAATATRIAVPPSAAPSEPIVQLANDEMSRLIKRGQDFLNEGDFAAARLLFGRAADAGSAEAALGLASTYDPAVIKQLGAVAVTPDIDRALKWYATAADRGSSDAVKRYADLMQAR